jgi:hypothetical protein
VAGKQGKQGETKMDTLIATVIGHGDKNVGIPTIHTTIDTKLPLASVTESEKEDIREMLCNAFSQMWGLPDYVQVIFNNDESATDTLEALAAEEADLADIRDQEAGEADDVEDRYIETFDLCPKVHDEADAVEEPSFPPEADDLYEDVER